MIKQLKIEDEDHRKNPDICIKCMKGFARSAVVEHEFTTTHENSKLRYRFWSQFNSLILNFGF